MRKTRSIVSVILSVVMVMSFPFTAFAADSASDYSSYTDFSQFRGSTMSAGIVDSKTPTSAEGIEETWKAAFGSGWMTASGTPIIVGEYMYVLSSKNNALERVSLQDGTTVASAPCPGGSQFFSTIGYGDGKIFVPRQEGSQTLIYAYDEQTMTMLWVSEPIGDSLTSIQPLSPVVYYDGRIYVGVSDGPAYNGAFACFTTTDEDVTKSDEVKTASWQYKPETGSSAYYWSGAAITGKAAVFAGEASELVLHSLNDATVYDTYDLGHAGVRSTASYDADTGRVYVTTKDGYLCSVKINSDNTFDKSSYVETKLGNDVTSSPVSFKGRVYVGGGGISSDAGFSVLNADDLSLIYQIKELRTQSSPILTTAYATAENNWEVKLYVTDYERPSGLWMITDKQGQTEGDATKLIDPSEPQYCTQSVTVDKDGSLYYFNDTGKMFAFKQKEANAGVYAAQDVINAIKLAESKSEISLNDEFTLLRTKARYESLNATQQAEVFNYDKLSEMLTRIEKLKDESAVVAELNQSLEKLVVADVTLEDDAVISAWYASYLSLSDSSKELVLKADLLKQAVDKIQHLKDNAMIITIKDKIAALPSVEEVVLDDKTAVEEVDTLLKNQNEAVQAGVDKSKLSALLNKIDAIDAAIKSINKRIFDEIDPMNVTISDKTTVEELMKAYQALNEKDRKHIIYYDDLLFAQKVIAEFEKNQVIIPDVFANLVGSDKNYTIPGKTETGKDYTITFNGADITDPTIAFHSGISFDSPNKDKIKKLDADALVISFKHRGALPGRATIEIAVDLKDGQYTLYYFNEETGKAENAGKVLVTNGKAVFSITHASDYFISAKENLAAGNASGSENSGKTPTTGDKNTAAVVIALAISAGALLFLRKRKLAQ